MDKLNRPVTGIFINGADTSWAHSERVRKLKRARTPESITDEHPQPGKDDIDTLDAPPKSKLRKVLVKDPARSETNYSFEALHSKRISSHLSGDILTANPGDPWRHYEWILTYHDLGGDVDLAITKANPEVLVNIRVFTAGQAEHALSRIQQLPSDRFVKASDAYATNKSLHVVFEEMQINLTRIIKSTDYPTPHEVGAIVGQILDGLAYLEEEELEHTSLGSNVLLLNTFGEIKIGYQELCQKAKPGSKSRAVSKIRDIVRELINKDKTVAGVQRSEWLSCSEGIDFVAATSTAKSAKELLKHPFLALYGREGQMWHRLCLRRLINRAATQFRRDCLYSKSFPESYEIS